MSLYYDWLKARDHIMMDNTRLLQIIERISSNTATEEDVKIYNTWCNSMQQEQGVTSDFGNIKSDIFNAINQQIDSRRQSKYRSIVRISAIAASLVIGLLFGSYFLINQQKQTQLSKSDIRSIRIGGNKAILTLANGSQIVLNNVKNGKLIQQANVAINKTKEGEVVYATTGLQKSNADLVYNTMLTPRGGQYQLTLADGTKVWLNAASSITYPVAFTGAERTVTITGEVYFEVAHNAAKPFIVSSNGQIVRVLGTHFNINAYDNEPEHKTTLLEGSVKVTHNGNTALLTPGQQARWGDNELSVTAANVNKETAWKNGNFQFDHADIKTIMRQLVRWYDVDIKYNSNLSDRHYTGTVPRNNPITTVLQMLEETGGTNFAINGKTIVVTN